QWILVRIPMSAVNLSNIQYPALFTANVGPSTFFVDNVHFINSTIAPNFNVSIINRSNGTATSQVTWPTLSSPTGWVLADQYLSVETDSTVLSWGVQIYTNN